jgi:Tfp pilus assembly protein PilF
MTTVQDDRNAMTLQDRLHRVSAALAANDVAKAITLAHAALDAGAEDPLFYNLVAHDLEERGQFKDALALLNRAYQMAPNDVIIVNAIGLCLMLQGQFEDAIVIFDMATLTDSSLPQSHFNKADALASLRRYEEARICYGRALALYPGYADALSGIAMLSMRQNAMNEARGYAKRALELDPGQHIASLVLAETDTLDGDSDAAESRLRGLLAGGGLKPQFEADAASLLGDALNAQGRAEEAFAAYETGNNILLRLRERTFARDGVPSVLEMVRWLKERFEASDPKAWATAPALPAPGPAEPAGHIFFVGFPRSGTTLLENILASHPEVVAMDEREILPAVSRDLFSTDDGFARLEALTEEQAQPYREAYWRGVAQFCPDIGGKVFVDKLPLASVWQPVMAKLFPDAKVIFARRDPRDVVLSCFRRRFGSNPATYQFLTLEGASSYYDGVMAVSQLYAERLKLPLHTYRYEDLVADFEGQVRAICDFIGIAWDDAMLDFADKAQTRVIRTPSARQVRRGLYREGSDQWRPYAQQLAPVMPLLQPWIEAFGYEEA